MNVLIHNVLAWLGLVILTPVAALLTTFYGLYTWGLLDFWGLDLYYPGYCLTWSLVSLFAAYFWTSRMVFQAAFVSDLSRFQTSNVVSQTKLIRLK